MNLNNSSGIYSITNTLNGDSYIGQSICLRKRKNNHFQVLETGTHCNCHLQRAYNKYGREVFMFMPILYCEPFELTRYEQALTDSRKPAYNIQLECVDSSRGIKRSEETRRKNSEANKGRVVSDETRRRLSEANKGNTNGLGNTSSLGKHLSEETRVKIGEAAAGNQRCLGRELTEETRLKISDAQKGKVLSEAHKHNLGEAMKGNTNCLGRIVSEETRRLISAQKKASYKARRELQLLEVGSERIETESLKQKQSYGTKEIAR